MSVACWMRSHKMSSSELYLSKINGKHKNMINTCFHTIKYSNTRERQKLKG